MNIGKAMMARATLTVVPMTKIGVRVQVIPRARIRITVVVMLAPDRALEMAKKMIAISNDVIPRPAWSDSGA